MPALLEILDHSATFDPAAPFDPLVKAVPAKAAVYLFTDVDDRPVQLLCVKNLRYSIKRRLGEPENDEPTRRIDYRSLVRNVHWRLVYSDFEADLIYLEAARLCFPESYRGMTGFAPAWFLHVNPEARFPRYSKTIDLGIGTGVLIGPVENKQAAGKLIEETQDWFDLCRYYHILTQAPSGLACAYKEMGKCPAPCDGSISMTQYQRMIQWSADSIVEPQRLIADQTARMKAAAGELRFEAAGKIKQYVESLSKLGKTSLRHVRRMRDFQFLSLQRGPRNDTAKVFLISPGNVEDLAAIISEPPSVSGLLRHVLERSQRPPVDRVDEAGAERIGVVTSHLFAAKNTSGAFLPLESIDEKAIIRAFKDVQKQKKPEPEEVGEGVTKELQML